MKDHKNLNNNKMPKKNNSDVKKENLSSYSTKKNKFIGLVIDSDTDSDTDSDSDTNSHKTSKIIEKKVVEQVKKNNTDEIKDNINNLPYIKTQEQIDEDSKIPYDATSGYTVIGKKNTNNAPCEPLEPMREINLPKKERNQYDWTTNDNKKHHRAFNKKAIIEKELFEHDENVNYGDDLYLPSQWDIYCHKKSISDWTKDSYSHIYQVDSIGTFCRFFNNFNNLDKLTYDFFIMKDKILPIWEDNANRNGGICSILLNSIFDKQTKTDVGSEMMLSICLLLMNGSLLQDNNKINGISYSLRARNTVLIKIWYNNCKFDMKEQLPFSLFEYFEGKINGGSRNDSISKHISIRFSNIEPMN